MPDGEFRPQFQNGTAAGVAQEIMKPLVILSEAAAEVIKMVAKPVVCIGVIAAGVVGFVGGGETYVAFHPEAAPSRHGPPPLPERWEGTPKLQPHQEAYEVSPPSAQPEAPRPFGPQVPAPQSDPFGMH